MTEQLDAFDTPWKDVLESYFQDFMQFYFPQIHDEIDWSRGPSGPFFALGAQEVPDGSELVFEVFGPGLLGGGCGNCRLQRSTTLFPKNA
jgi:hypothetical protein